MGGEDRVADTPRLPLRASIDAITSEVLDETERRLADLAAVSAPVGPPARHPWRDMGRTFYTPAALEVLGAQLTALVGAVRQLSSMAAEVTAQFALPPICTLANVEMAAQIAAVFRESPGAPLAVLESDVWNAPPAEATALIEAGRQLQRWRQQLDQRFHEAALDQDHASDIALVETKLSGTFGFLAIFNGRFRAIKRRWTSYRKPGYTPPLIDQATDLKRVDQYRRARQAAEQAAALAQVEAAATRRAYVRPSVPAYRLSDGQGRYAGGDFLEASSGRVVAAIVEVVNVESPVHVDDLSRAGMRVQADRIAPEEIQGAITLVLQAAGGMTRDELLSEMRQVIGAGRTIAPAFDDALTTLARAGRVGEGSVGYALRG